MLKNPCSGCSVTAAILNVPLTASVFSEGKKLANPSKIEGVQTLTKVAEKSNPVSMV
eukprot:CAMPEP_0116996224 /NCGR_PEP_ID=MMETSP0472-20121206/108_1 /TAXON_ID=693140 ORGANISM="Tiarina fusus, Strain LIS" /NCGR_SAMPLE_ID=MMETSP0472 /ASSEMBLY_ACC=CAM_ASM_000603 /LENGTH=56 /DNA_ID=CAMNT_0004694787 /DNA_START=1007 /DNA_END=1177 /DNA_ORIENTATION=-